MARARTTTARDIKREEAYREAARAEKRYNGWTNYETWAFALHMNNDEGCHNHWRGVASLCLKKALGGTRGPALPRTKESAALELADCIKSDAEDSMPELGPNVYSDLLGAALSEVNWYEIAKSFLEE